MKRPLIVVWFSCGAASAVAAKITIEIYADTHDIRVVNNPVKEEHPDNQRFARDVSAWIQWPIETASNPKFPDNSAVTVWDREKFMAGIAGAPCTKFLKKEARYLWEKENNPDFHVMGFCLEERSRHENFILSERPNTIPVLINAGLTKGDCFARLVREGIRLPQSYYDGFPNANCEGCVKATSATYWNHVRRMYPDVFAARAEQSRRLGAKLVRYTPPGEKRRRVFLDELPENATGEPMADLNFECGIFCEEPAP